jgi:glycerophosphoryl diester phosphodiesterase
MRSPLLSAMRFVGHRGASHVAPENTIAAFRAAAARGVGFECDLQALRDGTLLVLHDDTLLRTATAPPGLSDAASRRWADLVRTPVGELDYEDVCDVDIGSWMSTNFASERPPRFEETLGEAAPDIFAELKCEDDGYSFDGRLPDLVGALALPPALTWISFSLPLVEELKRRDSERPCLHVAEPRTADDAWAAARVVCNSAVDGIDLPADPALVTPELVQYLPVWKSTSVSGAQFFTKSFLGDDVAALVPSSGEEPTPPRHRAGVASMAWRSTRLFRTNAP